MVRAASAGEEPSTQQPGFWSRLQEAVSLANYLPQPAAGAVARPQDGDYVLKNPQAGTYMRLSPEEYTLWTWMDGRRTVRELAVEYFLRYHRFMPVAELVRRLRTGGLLSDPPAGVLSQLQVAIQQREEPWGRRLLGLLWGRPVVLKRIGGFFRACYRLGGRLLFTRPVRFLQGLTALAGFVAFVLLLIQGRRGYEILQAGHSYFLGLLLLLLLNAATLSLHECAHALATIHQGCDVRRGGFLLYLGLPALFVDTTDTWMVGKKGRIAVAAAGPWNDLVLGGLCALLSLPHWSGGPWLLKIATLAYISALFNLSPLLELDGYYILSDTLDMPYLRRDALAFVRRDFWARLRRRQSLPPQERLYAAYGLLALLYLAVVAGLVFLFWRTQVTHLVADLLGRGLWGRVAAGLLAAAIGAPLAILLGRRAVRAGRRGWKDLSERGFLSRGSGRFALVAGASLAFILLFRLLPESWQLTGMPLLPPLFYLIALACLVGTLPFYRGTPFRRVFLCLLALLVVLAVGNAVEGLWGWAGVGSQAAHLAQLGALLTALAAFSAQDLVRARSFERLAMAVLLGCAFLLALAVARQVPASSPWTATLWPAGSIFLGGLALAIFLPTLVSFATTPFAPSWIFFVLALLLSLVRCVPLPGPLLAAELDLGIAFLMAQGAALYLLAQRYLVYRGEDWTAEPAIGTHARLHQAFHHFFAGLFALFRNTFGRRRAQILDDRLDVIAVTANWPLAVDNGRVREDAEMEGVPLEELAARYTELLNRTVEIMDDLAGRPFLQRAIQGAYDSLPWAEREALVHSVLGQTPWGSALSRDFLSLQDEDLRLLAGVALFFGCDEATLTDLRAALHEERAEAGQVIARQGEEASHLHIVAGGEVEVWQEDEAGRDRLVAELHRGDTFGEDALLGGNVYRATYRASVDTAMLGVAGATMERALQSRPFPSEQMRTRAHLFSWLASLDLLQGLSWRDLQAMAGRLRHRHVPAWEVIIREGRPTDAFYLIEEGKVLVVKGWGSEAEEIRGELGPGEYFGEIAPLLGGGATATVVTTEVCAFWTLAADEFRWFLERGALGALGPPSLLSHRP